MNGSNFRAFFEKTTGNSPYPYQCRLACGEVQPGESEQAWLSHGTDCQSFLINIPTGLGKTAAVVMAWLWNRIMQQNEQWPRRLVYCLPMRTLVEQTEENVAKWIEKLVSEFPQHKDLQWLKEHSPIILMGGEDLDDKKRDWDIHPEKPCILIGTQDMLLSRALNRGYGMSRARWPMHFGLLNNDCLWVLDETQLIGVGVRTSAQLEGLRSALGAVSMNATWWASATLDARLLQTPDLSHIPDALSLTDMDLQSGVVKKRIQSVKRISQLPFPLTSDATKVLEPYVDQLAKTVLEKHQSGTTSIVIVNRVKTAKWLFSELDRISKKQTLPKLVLIHSQFRPMERDLISQTLMQPGEKIIIATQAIEAGVDISARTLITELASWSSLVQRFGRCNRSGEFNDIGGADIFWINLEGTDEKAACSLALPYTPEQFAAARTMLQKAESTGAAPAELAKLRTEEPVPESHILRKKDLVELFDTTPDLVGLDIDVSRYIREGEDRDVQVFWRKIEAKSVPSPDIEPIRKELVRAPIGEFQNFFKKESNRNRIWNWDPLDGQWQMPERISPGQIYLIDAELGGYSEKLGWTGEKSKEAFEILMDNNQANLISSSSRDGQGLDTESQMKEGKFQTIEEHTELVILACGQLIQALPQSQPWKDAVLTAAKWHDVGKAHSCFQRFIIRDQQLPSDMESKFIAKAPWKSGIRHVRPHFRHELASALAWLQAGNCQDEFTNNLVAYLIASHHGKVRLSIRSMPGEMIPNGQNSPDEILFARGIWHGEKLPGDSDKKLELEGFPAEPIVLDLSCMQMGEHNNRPSWTSRTLTLRDQSELGIFRLAWLETLLRAADAQGSKENI